MAQTPAEHSALCRDPHGITGARTGLPAPRAGIESMSGHDASSVQVHHASASSAIDAHAFSQGSAIHLAPGQEQHLPHEAWHVAQQAGAFRRPAP